MYETVVYIFPLLVFFFHKEKYAPDFKLKVVLHDINPKVFILIEYVVNKYRNVFIFLIVYFYNCTPFTARLTTVAIINEVMHRFKL